MMPLAGPCQSWQGAIVSIVPRAIAGSVEGQLMRIEPGDPGGVDTLDLCCGRGVVITGEPVQLYDETPRLVG
jgi:hypothetical protein